MKGITMEEAAAAFATMSGRTQDCVEALEELRRAWAKLTEEPNAKMRTYEGS